MIICMHGQEISRKHKNAEAVAFATPYF